MQRVKTKVQAYRQTTWGRWLEGWYRFDTPEGVLNWQISVNGLMLTALLSFGQNPWFVFAVLGVLMAFTLWLHGRHNKAVLCWYAGLGYVSEIWTVILGPVWVHSAPIGRGFGLDDVLLGGVGGVPFFMLPAWGMLGALMLALTVYFNRVPK